MAAPEPEAPPAARSRAKDHSPWNWLLFIPIVLPLIPVFFNADSPRFLGFPRFYWLQLAYILVGVATTTLVYQLTKKRAAAPSDGLAGADAGDR
ncbi:DUF3311 domain-containing protein [Micromonospora peucetia]|uniref:DUF3311 domain-containing protein n=1 Tax=Micromonospora peucetia TaxID=47871 RepID=A0A1C6VNH4_9ACTN|nr:DUF3311 domain-containing protein [Micromonospora peucetia]MCX4388698.1 DUF3311 domain-containing protein [Micromonospora peucetia]WSA30662.1 DUF3311 domain-containing protein [Micromonospora peucetia]SCL67644.1 Protein of unknown function (DUF3311) [Micromonospora peucetia]